MDLDNFKERFYQTKAQGFIKSARKGPTGIGYTLEKFLGLAENNLSLPDLGKIELKAHRDNTNNFITLFTFNRKAWVMKPLEAIRKYGTFDKNGRQGLYFTMSPKPNSSGLFLMIADGAAKVQHVSGDILVSWNIEAIAQQFQKKIPALILVTAREEERDGAEYFHYYSARLLSGTTPSLLEDQLRYGDLLIDLRLHDKGTSARNHGTGFRVSESRLEKLFRSSEEL